MSFKLYGKAWLEKSSAELLRNLPLAEFMKQALELADPTLFGAAPPSAKQSSTMRAASTGEQPGEGGNYGERLMDYAVI